jgi:uncharacterized cupredoxin-like copper-binding protein
MRIRRNVVPRLVVASTAAVALAPALAAPSALAAKAHAASTKVTVTAIEFKFTLSKKSVKHGTVVFDVVNKGKLSHDFKIDGKKTPLIKPGKSATLTVTFAKAGSYPYLCTVPGHAAAGMKGTLKVT